MNEQPPPTVSYNLSTPKSIVPLYANKECIDNRIKYIIIFKTEKIKPLGITHA